MNYGKIIDGKIKYAPDTYVSNDGTICISGFNTNKEMLKDFGYKPIKEIRPENIEGLTLLETYEETEIEIVVTYSVNNTESYLNSLRDQKIYESKENLVNYLATHPLKSTVKDGIERLYTVTQDKQNMLTNTITTYLNSSMPYILTNTEIPENIKTIYWNCSGHMYKKWTYEEICKLKDEINEYIRPLISMQQHLEVVLYGLPTQQEIKNLNIDYTHENIQFWLINIAKK